ncbi:MAG: peptidoglycan editing factor PgeF [Rhodobacteraceae bacterium]|nr:peptidoglycan editing factor PgeF [Paracoccaceae bacterium]
MMGVSWLESELLHPFRHGFFARRGGHSSGVCTSLNCGFRLYDSETNVRANRRLVARHIGVEVGNLLVPHQRHTSRVQFLSESSGFEPDNTDGLVTNRKGLAVAVLTADCLPLLLADRENMVIAAVHAGWRGMKAGIIENAVRSMELAGAQRKSTNAVIGPAISQANYEVGAEVVDMFLSAIPDCEGHFRINPRNRFDFDLTGLGLELLKRSGVGCRERMSRCTYDDERNCFSCRRSHHRGESGFGVMISAISM